MNIILTVLLVLFIIWYMTIFLDASLLYIYLGPKTVLGILQALWAASIVPFLMPIDQIYKKTSWSNNGYGIRDSLIPMGMTTIRCEEDETKTKQDCAKENGPEPLYPVKY